MHKVILIIVLIFFSNSSYSDEKNKTDVEFSSDNVEVDKNKNLMIATGNVIINSKNMTVKADKVVYDKKADKAFRERNA